MPEKLKMQSGDIVQENIEKVGALFPNCITEVTENGITKHAIDFETLKQELSQIIADPAHEKYQFTWPEKTKARILANTPVKMTLRPCRDGSIDFDNTKNLYIEGDNLDVLKVLRETYLGKIKMIYIDPPYNTGNDFVYDDDFSMDVSSYSTVDGDIDEYGNRLRANTLSNGRFHTDWLNMIYPRLKVAKDCLTDDGSIFISIDDNEYDNLKKICDEIFGSNNYVATIVWKRKRGRDNSARWFSKSHEYLLVYARKIDLFTINRLELDDETKKAYKNPDNDPRGEWRMLGCWARGTQGGVKYDFTSKTGQYFSERLWLMSKEKLTQLDTDDKLVIRGDNVYRKMFIFENEGKIPETLWDDVSNAANAADEIKKYFGTIVFDTPKPIPYLKQIIKIATNENDMVMDFFSGSSTTADAIFQLNNEDGKNRKFILIQIPEELKIQTSAYHTVCDIGKERIRFAGNKYVNDAQTELPGLEKRKIDVGFRIFKLDSTNMKNTYYSPSETPQISLDGFVDNIKSGRTHEDLLFQVMLDLNIELSAPIEKMNIAGKEVFSVDDGYLMACFMENISNDVVIEIAKRRPYHFVLRDSSMVDDSVATNFDQIFKTYSPDTIRSVL